MKVEDPELSTKQSRPADELIQKVIAKELLKIVSASSALLRGATSFREVLHRIGGIF